MPDPRIVLICYLSWYAAIWVQLPGVLVGMFLLQLVVFLLLRGFTTGYRHILFGCVLVGAILSVIGVTVAGQSFGDLAPIWAKWGILILATLSVTLLVSPRELFVALRFYRVPNALAFSLWVSLKALPLVLEQARGVSLALRARGYGPGRGWRRIVESPGFVMRLMLPTLTQILKRGEQLWFAVELRGMESIFVAPSNGGYSIMCTAVAVILLPLPIVAAVLY